MDDLQVRVQVPGNGSVNGRASAARSGNEESTFNRIFSDELRSTRRSKKSPKVQGKWSKADLRAFLSPELKPKQRERDTSWEAVSPKHYSVESPTRKRHLRYSGARGEIRSNVTDCAGEGEGGGKTEMFADEPVSFEGTPLGKGSSYEAFKRGQIDEASFLEARSRELREEHSKEVRVALEKHVEEENEARRLRDAHRSRRKQKEVEIMRENMAAAEQRKRESRRGRQQKSTKQAFFEAIYAGQPSHAEVREKKARYARELASQRREVNEQKRHKEMEKKELERSYLEYHNRDDSIKDKEEREHGRVVQSMLSAAWQNSIAERKRITARERERDAEVMGQVLAAERASAEAARSREAARKREAQLRSRALREQSMIAQQQRQADLSAERQADLKAQPSPLPIERQVDEMWR